MTRIDVARPTKIFEEANQYIIRTFGASMQGGVNTAWDINNGCCEEWAEYVCKKLKGATLVWIDEFAPELIDEDGFFDGPAHCVVSYRGKLYDAECHEGAKGWRDLPIEKNKGLSRKQALANFIRRKMNRCAHSSRL